MQLNQTDQAATTAPNGTQPPAPKPLTDLDVIAAARQLPASERIGVLAFLAREIDWVMLTAEDYERLGDTPATARRGPGRPKKDEA